MALDINVDIWFIKEKDIEDLTVTLKHIEMSCDRKVLERIMIKGFKPNWNRS